MKLSKRTLDWLDSNPLCSPLILACSSLLSNLFLPGFADTIQSHSALGKEQAVAQLRLPVFSPIHHRFKHQHFQLNDLF